jgi:diguanylate cyclase (GGDEF)-like protein
MEADMVVLRMREGEDLVVIGAMADGGVMIQGLDSVTMDDDGPTSRAARRGRSVRLDRDAELTMGGRATTAAPGSPSSQTGRAPLESGVVTPLIVGARVVGTMSCWSRKPSQFTLDDERLLEMMASSVATAIVASETVDTSEKRALIDPLTELPNRRQLNEDLAGSLADLLDDGRTAVVLMADVDHFKHFNDAFGHRTGDITLQKVAARLRAEIREHDFIYRFGGEEFLIVFPDVDRAEGLRLAERLRAAMALLQVTDAAGASAGSITISIGIACLPDDAPTPGRLIELADAAMYESKQSGRNQVTAWHEALSEKPAA